LGAVAFEMLTGRPPFVGDSLEKILRDHVLEPPPDLTSARPDIPRDLAALVAELLSKPPEERPPDAEAVVWRLERLRSRRRPTAIAGLSGRVTPTTSNVGRAHAGMQALGVDRSASARWNVSCSGTATMNTALTRHDALRNAVLFVALLLATFTGVAFALLLR
jgi:serine/threonine-protein kinase